MIDNYIFSIVIYKLCHYQEFCIVNLLKNNKNLKINFYYTILALCFSINLKVKYNKNPPLNTKKVKK